MDLTRGQFLRTASGGILGALLPAGGAAAAAGPARVSGSMEFRSRPDLRPPHVAVSGEGTPAGDGYFFLSPTSDGDAQSGSMIVDSTGQLVWFSPVQGGLWVTNFRVQEYAKQPVLAWWEGMVDAASGYGRGSGVILDTSYRQIGRIHAANGRHADLHELLLTREGTALMTCYPDTVEADLSAIGGPRKGHALQSVIQEVEIRTGRLLFEWRSLEHIPITETYFPAWGGGDYLHVNSIDVTRDGHLLVSARHTNALYKLHRRTGRVLWRLGGKRSDFAMGAGTRFAWQHDARARAHGRITLFDDGAGVRRTESQSRGLVLSVDHARRRVELLEAYHHPRPLLLAYAMGSMQLLEDGSVVLGWGNFPGASEFAPDGSLMGDLRLPWGHPSYRAFRLPWSAQGPGAPALGVRASGGSATLYASWNGATSVVAWRTSAGPSPSSMSPVGVTPRTGFETVISLPMSTGYAAVTALDSSGQDLGTSRAIAL